MQGQCVSASLTSQDVLKLKIQTHNSPSCFWTLTPENEDDCFLTKDEADGDSFENEAVYSMSEDEDISNSTEDEDDFAMQTV